jgi:Uncharacterized membrane protein, putative virulence factor
MSLVKNFVTVGGATLSSRLLGFVRDVFMANMLGSGPIADAFFVAFRLPNLFRRLFAEGAFSSAFVPLFARALTEGGKTSARALAEDILAVSCWHWSSSLHWPRSAPPGWSECWRQASSTSPRSSPPPSS